MWFTIHSIGCQSMVLGGGPGTHILRHAGMCRSNRSLFHKKALNMGPICYKNIPKHGLVFPKSPKFWRFTILTPEQPKILKNGPIFQKKSLKMGKLFYQNDPLKMGYGFQGFSSTPSSKPNLSTPPQLNLPLDKMLLLLHFQGGVSNNVHGPHEAC